MNIQEIHQYDENVNCQIANLNNIDKICMLVSVGLSILSLVIGFILYKNNIISYGIILGCITIFIIFGLYQVIRYFINNRLKTLRNSLLNETEKSILKFLNLSSWKYLKPDKYVTVKSSKSCYGYNATSLFKEYDINDVENVLNTKSKYINTLQKFIQSNEFMDLTFYEYIKERIKINIEKAENYVVTICYSSPAGRKNIEKTIQISQQTLAYYKENPYLYMGTGAYNKMIKEQNKQQLEHKQRNYYELVNVIVNKCNYQKDKLVLKADTIKLDNIVGQIFDRTINAIKKIKTIDSEEWNLIKNFIDTKDKEIDEILNRNRQIISYYSSDDFLKIKTTCDSLMLDQREFNEYINEKASSISSLFGTRVVRNETVFEDEFNYIRPYKKTITPFTAEVSAAVFASAENDPINYVIKLFYTDKEKYPEQIQALQTLIEELETLKEAKNIIEQHKLEYQQYLTEVPQFIMDLDKDGFYAKLGFANISEEVLTVEYKFIYTSNGGFAQRSFTVPMTEENIIELIKILENKLTYTAFAKEQRALMTSKLRQFIKERDNYTCRYCGNSTYKEPNLLLEIDHIIPIKKGGCTVEDNLQTLCWRCNRTKSSKIVDTLALPTQLKIHTKEGNSL